MIKSFICEEGKIKELSLKEVARQIKGNKHIWVDVEGPTKEDLDFLEKNFGFHHLALDDCVSNQRSKIDFYGRYCFVVTHVLNSNVIAPVQLNFFLSKKYLVTVHSEPVKAIILTEEKCKKRPDILSKGPDFLAYSILDTVIDEFFPLIDDLENRINIVENKIFESRGIGVLNQLLSLKRKIFGIRKIVWPMRDVLNIISRGDFKFVKPDHVIYYRDIYDHVIRIIDIIDMEREMITTGMEGYLTTISNYLNVIMKKLTSITAILAVPALIAAVYGMNFQRMPELQWEYGYYTVIIGMILSVILLYVFFHKKDWI